MTDTANPLSKREQEILELVARGLSNQEIARDLVISLNTVKVHLRNIFAKLDASSRTDALVRAAQAGWVAVSGLEEEAAAAPVPVARAAEPPLPRWQRVYFVLAAVVVIAALLLPDVLQNRPAAATANAFSDSARNQSAVPPRVEVSRWNSLAPLPVARSRLALAALPGQLLAIGGEGPQGISSSTYRYDTEANGWLRGADKPTATANTQAVVLDGLVYVPGGSGSDGAPSAVLEIYDAAADSWHSAAALPEPRSGSALAAFGGRLYLFGGWNGTRYVNSTWMYDPAADRWSERAAWPEHAAFAAAATLPDRIIVAGGYDGRREYSACHAYFPTDDRWAACAPLNRARGGLGMAADGNSIYAVGGGWQQVITFNERYDSLTNTWALLPSPVEGKWLNPGVAGDGSLVYVVGGWNGNYLDNTEAFQGTFRAFLPLGTRGQ
ncbi:MAG: LuxR C-terminal-related transcriptional regulator [Caldilineales bacterium]